MAIEWRPPGEPRFGGHIERLIGTQMGRLHLLPGTIFKEQELGEYDSKRHAARPRELERYIALDIVGSLSSIHGTLGRPPIAVWREHDGAIPLRLPQDRLRFWLTFLREQERTLRRLLVKYDPGDMARIFIRRPSGNFVEARFADVTLPSITLHEAMTARRALLAKGRREITPALSSAPPSHSESWSRRQAGKRQPLDAGKPLRNRGWMIGNGLAPRCRFQQTCTLC